MANNWFRFKHFTIHQGECAMKVTTDACLFGAWIPLESKPKTMLDIGAGTGLLSIMLAQRFSNVNITSLEIDKAAARQAKENVAASPFSSRVKIIEQSIQEFASETSQQFDLLVCNPPFFKNHLTSSNEKVNAARHQKTLTLEELAHCMARLRSPDGYAAVLLPEKESQFFAAQMNRLGLWPVEQVEVLNKPGNRIFRTMILYGQKHSHLTSQLHIRDEEGQYSVAFQALLKPLYLKL